MAFFDALLKEEENSMKKCNFHEIRVSFGKLERSETWKKEALEQIKKVFLRGKKFVLVVTSAEQQQKKDCSACDITKNVKKQLNITYPIPVI